MNFYTIIKNIFYDIIVLIMTWSGRRKFLISFFIVVFVVLPFLYVVYINIKPESNCFDRRKNGDENGIDCGGSCQLYCPYERRDIVVVFSRAQKITDGLYNVVALVENKNTDALSPIIKYKFKLYDEFNIPIAVRDGYTYINPNTRQAIFEGAVNTGSRDVARVVFEFEKPITWLKTDMGSFVLPISVGSPDYEVFDDKPSVRFVLQNTSFESTPKGNSVVIAYDKDNNAVGFSSTILDEMEPNSRQVVVFSWPYIFSQDVLRFELYNQVDIGKLSSNPK